MPITYYKHSQKKCPFERKRTLPSISKIDPESPKESAIFDHILYPAHNPSFDDFETFVKDSNEF